MVLNLLCSIFFPLWTKYLVYYLKGTKIFHNWHKKDWKRFDKIKYSKALNQWIMGWFFNLIPFIYLCTSETNEVGEKKLRWKPRTTLQLLTKKLETENLATAHLKAKKLFQYTPGTTRKLLQSKLSLHAQGIGRTELLFFQKIS